MKVLIFGGSGFLGRHLIRHLSRLGHEILAPTSRELDLTGIDLARWDPGTQFDRIYHLAAWTRAGDFCARRGGDQWIINQQINTNVLAFWARKQPQARLVAFGTSVSYPKEVPLTEENYMQGTPIDRYYAYAMSKRMLLAGLQSLHRQYGLEYNYIIPSTLYGPDYHLDGRPLHFIYDLIRKIIRGQRYGDPVVLWGDGHQKRELVYVEDFIRILDALVEKTRNDLFNVGAGEEHSIREFASIICEQVGFPAERIEYDTGGFVGARSKILCVDKARNVLGDYPVRPLRDGLCETIRWAIEAGLHELES